MININFTLTYFELYLILINISSFILYGYDKLQALKNSRNITRISENKLLFFSLLGGFFGSTLAMFIFRHKIKKVSFIIKFAIVTIIQIVTIYFYMSQGNN